MARQVPSGAKARGKPLLSLPALRQLHIYLGMFIAPSVLFFACTGSLQLFGLHEAHGAYRPAPLIEKLGMVHKDQVFAAKPKPGPAAARPKAAGAPVAHDAGPKPTVTALKWFFLFVAVDLVASTCLGLWMGLRYSRRKGVAWLLLLAGAAIPMALVLS